MINLDFLDDVSRYMYEILRETVLKKKKIYEMADIDEVLGEKTPTEFYEMIDGDAFSIYEDYFFTNEKGLIISIDVDEFSDIVKETFKEMDYEDKIKLLKKATKEMEK